MPSNLITIDELAERLHVSRGTLYNWAYLKRIPYIKVGRCLRFDFDEVMRRLRGGGTIDAAAGGRGRS